jgi:phosphohistidine phosphatase
MKLYIVRHAIAEERVKKLYTNDDRPLTKIGIRTMEKNAAGIAKIIVSPLSIISSPLKRAYNTSEILASKFRKSTSITLRDDLLPGGSVENIIQLCIKHNNDDNVMLVGHEPSLGNFLSTILQQKNQSLQLKKGSICCVEFNVEFPKNSELLFYIPPRILQTISL